MKIEGDVMLRPERLGRPGLHVERVGAALRYIRKERKLTQRQLARRAGITPAMVSGYERGERLPSLRSLSYLLAALSAHVWHLERVAASLPAPSGRDSPHPQPSRRRLQRAAGQ